MLLFTISIKKQMEGTICYFPVYLPFNHYHGDTLSDVGDATAV
jgi:hypothetical protein